ncbi:MAG: hypothetical protein HYU77_04935 [Betaproteobacteria bacterium]|nr:hypothetical protein [Betaproteobacteria bacterium]
MNPKSHSGGWSDGFRHVVSHVAVTLLAIAIAFSLPAAARYILYQWWPKVENNTALLLVTEISLAAALVILLNGAKVAWDNRDRLASARSACLVHARVSNTWVARWKQQRFMRRFPRTRDAFILTLKFYDQEPFWKLIVLSDHVWVQYCHSGLEVKQQPEYVFGLQHYNPRQGFFIPFYMHFIEVWEQPWHPQYDFETGELLYRDMLGNERRRMPLGHGAPEPDPGRVRRAIAPRPGFGPAETRHETYPA